MRKKPNLIRRASGMMALEQRFMFDGAAVDTVVDVGTTLHGDVENKTSTLLQMVEAPALARSEAYQQARADAIRILTEFLAREDAKAQLFSIMPGAGNPPNNHRN